MDRVYDAGLLVYGPPLNDGLPYGDQRPRSNHNRTLWSWRSRLDDAWRRWHGQRRVAVRLGLPKQCKKGFRCLVLNAVLTYGIRVVRWAHFAYLGGGGSRWWWRAIVTSPPQAWTTVCRVSGAPPTTGKTPTGAMDSSEPSWMLGSAWEAAHRHIDKLEWQLVFFGFFSLWAEIWTKGGFGTHT
jgi:hypothetical protein